MLFGLISTVLVNIYGNIGSCNTSNSEFYFSFKITLNDSSIEGEFFCCFYNGRQHKKSEIYNTTLTKRHSITELHAV